MDTVKQPFLWHFVEEILYNRKVSDAREKSTESANEEHNTKTVIFD